MKKISELGPTQQKIMIALMGGVALGMCRTPKKYFQTFRLLRSEWNKIPQQNFNRSLDSLSDRKLLQEEVMPDGSFRLVLTNEGRKIVQLINAKVASIDLMKPKKWDGKWRVVIFDIPEKDRVFRDILRKHLITLEFKKLQHSVFVSPYPYEKSILKMIEIYSAKKYVRVMTVSMIDNEKDLKKYFSL